MDNLFLFICLLSFLFLVLGLANPKIAFVNSRKKVLIIYPIVMIISFIGVGVTGEPAPAGTTAQTETNKVDDTKKVDVKKAEPKKKDKKEEKPKKEEKEPLEQIKEKNYITSLELDKDNVVNVEIDAKNSLTVNFIIDKAVDILEDMETAFKDDKVTGYYAMVNMEMVDNKGNEREEEGFNLYYSREDFEELNYDKFSELSYSEPWRIFNESTSYLIHPVLFKEMKKEYKKNLIKGNNKPNYVEE